MPKRSPTTKAIDLLLQLEKQGQLRLAPPFQRDNVWTRQAKAYLIDTILNDLPVPLFFFQRGRSAQSGRFVYRVVDGQQRLRAIFEFINDKFSLSESDKKSGFYRKRYSQLTASQQDQIRNYDLIIEELSDYTDRQVRDIFGRMNKYGVRLSPQELRHAKGTGAFHKFATEVGKWPIWNQQRTFTAKQLKRFRGAEFGAELAILFLEGPQDKKESINLYYRKFKAGFPDASRVKKRINAYLRWAVKAVPEFKTSRYRKPVDLYALIGALDSLTSEGIRIQPAITPALSAAFKQFELLTEAKEPVGKAAAYAIAASRQTDNIEPRTARIEILKELISTGAVPV